MPESVVSAAPAEHTPYAIIDLAEQVAYQYEDVAAFADDSELGRETEAIILVKWTNQLEHDSHLQQLLSGGWDAAKGLSNAPSNRARWRYYDGLRVATSLDTDYLEADAATTVGMLQPTGVDIDAAGTEVYASGNKLIVAPLGDLAAASVIQHPLFARLHSAAFNADGTRVLTTASSLDMVMEVDVTSGSPTWQLDIWNDTPYNRNDFGHTLYRKRPANMPAGLDTLRNPDPIEFKDSEALRNRPCVVDNPARYNGLGLPTALMPAFINSVAYGHQDDVLATSYQRGEAWIIGRTDRTISVVADGMKRPHGLHADPHLDGYMVTDTVNEQVRFIDGALQQGMVYDLSGIAGRKPGLGDAGWLQYTTRLADDLYCAVMTSHQKLVLFNPVQKTKREIAFDPTWGVQLVAPAASGQLPIATQGDAAVQAA
jgi:hypothetical protein